MGTDSEVQRKFATILVSDIVGFSRMMAENEYRTLERVRSMRDKLVEPVLTANRGTVIKRTGDGSLVEFASIEDAMQAAASVQRNLPSTQEGYPENERIRLRIGINSGDILVADEDIFGDAVNIAARLEQLCLPGQIMLSGAAYDGLSRPEKYMCRFLGEQALKNIPHSVRAYASAPLGELEDNLPNTAEIDDSPMQHALPELPSIVVLPFVNSSDDAEQAYLCEGISEDIITELSRFRLLFVIGKNSAFAYRGREINTRQVSRELGVQYVLEGSVRRAGNRIRVTAQLLDAINDRQIWAERFDRDLDDVFEIQDEITRTIVGAVAPEMQNAEINRSLSKRDRELGVWELTAQANWHISKDSADDSSAAKALLEMAIESDPRNAYAYALMGQSYAYDGLFSWHRPPAESGAAAAKYAKEAIELDGKNDMAHVILAQVLFLGSQHQAAIERAKVAFQLNPNNSQALGVLGIVHTYTHDFDLALEELEGAVRLSPRDPVSMWAIAHFGVLEFIRGNQEKAVQWYKKAVQHNPAAPSPYRGIAASYGLLGDVENSQAAYREFDARAPGVTLTSTRESMAFAFDEDADKYAEGLRFAGMPE